ncbi:MAG: hypothetical protein ACYCUY_04405 [Acidithiobacillus sp.]
MSEQNQHRASEILYNELAASRNSVRRENAVALKRVCDQMEKDRVPMTVAEVVRRCGNAGPAYSTVSNTGSQLGDYVKLRMTEQAANMVPAAAGQGMLSDAIADPVLAAQVKDKESQARWLQKENTALRHLLKTLSPGLDIDGLIFKGKASVILPTSTQSDVQEVSIDLKEALTILMNHLTHDRQYIVERGRLTINKKVVLNPIQLIALQQVTGSVYD